LPKIGLLVRKNLQACPQLIPGRLIEPVESFWHSGLKEFFYKLHDVTPD
jgi:hypothetical protein